MYPIKIISIGKIKNQNLNIEFDELLRRIPRIENITLKEVKNSNINLVKDKEFESFKKYLSSENFVILLTEKGKNFTSKGLFNKLSKIEKPIIFLISGPYGPSESLISQVDLSLSLSQMTFTHEQALYILAEQLYRVHCFESGKEYSK